MFNDLTMGLIDDLGWTLLHFVWQGLFISVGAAVALMVLRRATASARYLVAIGAMALMAVTPIATLCWMMRVEPQAVRELAATSGSVTERRSELGEEPDRAAGITERSVVSVPDAMNGLQQSEDMPEGELLRNSPSRGATRPQPDNDAGAVSNDSFATAWTRERLVERLQPYLPTVVSVWLVGVCLLSIRMLWGWLAVQRMRRRATQPASEALQTLLARLMERLTMTRPVRLVESMLVEVPTVIGWLKPVILLPATALSGLSTEQLEALLAHELAHVRRNDYLINLLQTLVETLLFYHPAVWWLSRRIRIEREHCCDDLAVQVCGDELSYAKALVALEELRGPTINLALSAKGGSLLGRVARIIGCPKNEERPAWLVSAIGALVLVTIVISGWSELAGKPDAPDEKPLTQRLPNGTTVELIGLRLLTDGGDVWWSPSGKLISKPTLEVIEKETDPPKNLIGVLWRWDTEPKAERYEPHVNGSVRGATNAQGTGTMSSGGNGEWIDYVKWEQARPDTATVEVTVSENEPELEYGSPLEDISRLKVLFEKVSLKAGQRSDVTVSVDDSEQTLAMRMRRAAAEFFGGHMLVAFEGQVDAAAVSGRSSSEMHQTKGLIGWQSTGAVWRIDAASETQNPLVRGLQAGAWASGYDGEQLFHWSREDNKLILGSARDHCRQYEPKNLFWNSNGGGLESLLRTIAQKAAKIIPAQLNGLEGVRVEYVAEKDPQRRWSAFVCPSRGYLPLQIEQHYGEHVLWDSALSDLKEVRPGVWAPSVIRVTSYAPTNEMPLRVHSHIEYTVKEIEIDPKAVCWQRRGLDGFDLSFSSSHRDKKEEIDTSPFPMDFKTKGLDVGNAPVVLKRPRWGSDVENLVTGLSYHNDPWWGQLAPVLESKLGWPRTNLVPLQRLTSNISVEPNDEPLKSLPGLPLPNGDCPDDCRCDSFDSISKEKLDWKSLDDKVTLIAFWSCWNADSVAALSALKRLHETYAEHGLQILAVHRPRDADYARLIVKLMEPKFHIVIDAENESGNGELFDALKVRGMPTATLIDHHKKLRPILDANKVTDQIAELLKAAGAQNVPALKQLDPLTDEIGRAAEAEWKHLITKSEPRTQIKGRVVNAQNAPMAAVVVEIEPRLKLARGGYGGTTVYPDYKATKTFRTNANGVFEAESLPKGSFEVRIKAGGYARRTFDVAVGPGQPGELGEIVLDQRDAISGTVVDDQAQPLKGARVEALWRHTDPSNLAIKTRSSGAMPKTLVRGDGSFFLSELETGRYTLEFDADGHERAVREAVPLGWMPFKVWLDAYPEPLQRKVSLRYENAPLGEVLSYIRQAARLTIDLDVNELKKLDINEKQTVINVSVDDSCVGDALEKMFEPLEVVGFAWDGKRVFISTREIASKHRMPPIETIKGPPRERYAQKAVEIALQELEIAKKANLRVPGTIPEFEIKRLQLQVDAVRAEHELVLHDASQVIGQSITPEFMKKSTELLIKRVETFLALNKTLLEVANAENQKKPGSVKEQELHRLKKQIEDLEKDLARLTGKPQASAPFMNPQRVIRAASG